MPSHHKNNSELHVPKRRQTTLDEFPELFKSIEHLTKQKGDANG